METITHSEPLIALQVEVRESIRKLLKSKAALVGKTMGEYVTDLIERDSLLQPAPALGGTSLAAHRKASKPSVKVREETR